MTDIKNQNEKQLDSLITDDAKLWKRWHWAVVFGIASVLLLLLWSYLNFLCAINLSSSNDKANWLLRLFYSNRCRRLSSIGSPPDSQDHDQQRLSLSGTSLTLSGGNTIDLISLVGSPGPQGSIGISGASGSAGVTGATGPAGPIVLSNTLINDGINSLTSTVNGLSSSAGIINTNSLSLVGSNLTSTVNGLVSTPLDISSFDCLSSTTIFCQGGNSFGTAGVLGTNDTNELQLRTNGTTAITINASGEIGIGTTTPVVQLDVGGAGAGGNAGAQWEGVASAPALSSPSSGRVYFDSTLNKFQCSENAGAYYDCFGGAAPIVSANNGLTINPVNNVQLGGSLIQDTTITNNGFDLTFDGSAQDINIASDGSLLVNTATPVAGKVAVFNGDVKVTGVIDPTALLFSDQAPSSYSPIAGIGYKIGVTGTTQRPIYISPLSDASRTFEVRNTANTAFMSADSSLQRVGIGSGVTAPRADLDLGNTVNGGVRLWVEANTISNEMYFTGTGAVNILAATSGLPIYLSANNSSVRIGGQTNRETLTVAANNRVGIGTSTTAGNGIGTPSATLEVLDTVVGSASAISTARIHSDITTSNQTANITSLLIDPTDGANSSTGINTGLSVNLSGLSGGTNYAAIFNGGNVGVGTTTPVAQLDVAGTGSGGNAGIQWEGVTTAPALSTAGDGRIYFNSTSNQWECSVNTGAYSSCITAMGGSTNIYNTSSSFTANRTATMAGFDLTFDGSSQDITIADDGRLLVNTTTPVAGKVAVFNGDVNITGVIDPTALLFSDTTGSSSYNPATSNGYRIGVTGTTQRPVYISPLSNTTRTFEVRNAANSSTILDVDALNNRMGINTTAPTATAHIVSNETTNNAVTITGNALTSGDGLSISTTNAAMTGNILNVLSPATAPSASSGIARFQFTGDHAGIGLQIDDATTGSSGTSQAMVLTASDLTSGGAGLRVRATNAAATGQILLVDYAGIGGGFSPIRFNLTGNHTGIGFRLDDATTAGTIMQINASSLTSGTGLRINGSLNSGSTGNLLFVDSASTGAVTNGLARFNFSGAHTGNGLQINDATSTGNAMEITANSLTTGRALNVLANSTTNSVVQIVNQSNTTGTSVLTVDTGTTNTGTANLVLFDRYGSFALGSITKDNLSNSVTYNTTSDARLKENIVDTSKGLEDILNIRVVDYNYKNSGEHPNTMTGFLAQNLYGSFEDAVTATDNGVDTLKAGDTPWMVDYGRITPLLTKGIQQLNQKVDANQKDLLAQIADQQTEIEGLRSYTGLTQTCTVDTPGANGWGCSSDERLKQNIVNLSGGLDTLLQLQGVTYNSKFNPDGSPIAGFVAQEVEKILPGLIGVDSNGYKTLNKDGMIPYIVEAIKTQDGKLEDINHQLAGQGLKIESLAGELKELSKRVDEHDARFDLQQQQINQLKTEINDLKKAQSVQP